MVIKTIYKTRGGYKVDDFRELESPISHGILEPHIYEGILRNVPNISGKTKDITLTWDRFGRCSNWNREDCFIDF